MLQGIRFEDLETYVDLLQHEYAMQSKCGHSVSLRKTDGKIEKYLQK